MAEYIPIKPPPFDIELNIKLARKREKATLDKSNKKYIIKNIKTCTDFARSQRQKVLRSLQRRQENKFLDSRLTLEERDNEYSNFLDGESGIPFEETPNNLKQRRMQIIRRQRFNKTHAKANSFGIFEDNYFPNNKAAYEPPVAA
jgi:hypothetical protein